MKVPGTWEIIWYIESTWDIIGFGIYYEGIKDTELRGLHFQLGPSQFGVQKTFMLDLDREV